MIQLDIIWMEGVRKKSHLNGIVIGVLNMQDMKSDYSTLDGTSWQRQKTYDQIKVVAVNVGRTRMYFDTTLYNDLTTKNCTSFGITTLIKWTNIKIPSLCCLCYLLRTSDWVRERIKPTDCHVMAREIVSLGWTSRPVQTMDRVKPDVNFLEKRCICKFYMGACVQER